jgi:RNA polymerase sigma factor (sigma-70 family)
MPHSPLRTLFRHLQSARSAPGNTGPADAELLERFVRTRDEGAFELLVWRHGTLVYNTCLRILHDSHAAEDAFQATFLILVRKAASVGHRESLGAWLHRVAHRVALRARQQVRTVAEHSTERAAEAESDEFLWRDVRSVLDEEVNRLPEKYRKPVVLCYLSGLTTQEAARELGVPRGTILSRLAWARARLRSRLTLRGVTLSALALGVGLGRLATPALASILVVGTIRAVLSFAAGQTSAASPAAVNLMEGVMREMAMNKLKNGLLLAMALVVIGLGIGLMGNRSAVAEPPDRKKEEPARPVAAAAGAESKIAVKIPEAVRPIGVWEKTLAIKEMTMTTTLRIEANRVTLTIKQSAGGVSAKFLIEGEYSVAQDYTLYGIITAIDLVEVPKDGSGGFDGFGELVDQPFSFHYRFDDSALTMRDLKIGGVKKEDLKEAALFLGRFKKKGTGTTHADSD